MCFSEQNAVQTLEDEIENLTESLTKSKAELSTAREKTQVASRGLYHRFPPACLDDLTCCSSLSRVQQQLAEVELSAARQRVTELTDQCALEVESQQTAAVEVWL